MSDMVSRRTKVLLTALPLAPARNMTRIRGLHGFRLQVTSEQPGSSRITQD
jgi:hypothetical protein